MDNSKTVGIVGNMMILPLLPAGARTFAIKIFESGMEDNNRQQNRDRIPASLHSGLRAMSCTIVRCTAVKNSYHHKIIVQCFGVISTVFIENDETFSGTSELTKIQTDPIHMFNV